MKRKLTSEEWGTVLAILFIIVAWLTYEPLKRILPAADPEMQDEYIEGPR